MNGANNITFEAKVVFDGSLDDFMEVQEGLGKLAAKGLLIDTVPMPDDKSKGIMIDTVPLPELENEGLMIGTVPLPDRGRSNLYIGTIPFRPRPPFPGIPVLSRLAGTDLIEELTIDMPRLKIVKGIDGGIRPAHLHLRNEVVLLNEERFRKLVGAIAQKLGKELRAI